MERQQIIKRFPPEKGNLLNILHELQNNNPQNYLTHDDLREVAGYLNTSLSHIYGVVTYYTMYSLKPRGRHIIRVCNSPVCNLEGAPGIIEIFRELLGIEPGMTDPDGRFTLELTECLGRCAIAPSMMVGEKVYGNLDREMIKDILNQFK
ncbi:MAG: NAD(P)H-dependent oxidoreductase subunit E [Bacteroidales bacterium]